MSHDDGCLGLSDEFFLDYQVKELSAVTDLGHQIDGLLSFVDLV